MEFEEIISPVVEFYNGAHILITGGTGFMGRVLIEKLLRSCPGIERIYLIIRIKKDVDPAKRISDLLNQPVFEVLREKYPDFATRVTLILGDCGTLGLGISPEHRLLITQTITHVFHGAATVRFDEKIRRAFLVNIQGVRELLALCKECQRLKVVVHISTAFAHCPSRRIDEQFNKPPISGEKALEILEILDDKQLEAITPSLIEPWPNTYSFSKCIAEDLIKKFSGDLPITIVRPSIVIGCNKEPIPGWIDNVYGPTGVSLAVGAGLMRILCATPENKACMVPVDLSINAIICAAWERGTTYEPPRTIKPVDDNRMQKFNEENKIPIYNFVASEENILRWRDFKTYNMRNTFKVGSVKAIWVCICILQPNYTLFKIQAFFLHTIPGYIMDAGLYLTGNEPKLVEGYQKIHKFCDVIAYFATREWTFGENNTKQLWSKLSAVDKKIFDFDMTKVDWGTFFDNNLAAMRWYILNDPPSTIPAGVRKMRILNIANYVLCTLLIALAMWLIYPIASWIYSYIFST